MSASTMVQIKLNFAWSLMYLQLVIVIFPTSLEEDIIIVEIIGSIGAILKLYFVSNLY